MKKYSAILEMFYGRRGEGQLIKTTEEYQKQAEKLADIAERLKEKLKDDEEGFELLEEFFFASAGEESAAVDEHYREGFAFGVLMGMEIAGTR